MQLLKLKEAKYLKEISGLKKEMVATKDRSKVKIESSPATENSSVEQLKAVMAKNEAEYYESLQKYITNLDGMKKQV